MPPTALKTSAKQVHPAPYTSTQPSHGVRPWPQRYAKIQPSWAHFSVNQMAHEVFPTPSSPVMRSVWSRPRLWPTSKGERWGSSNKLVADEKRSPWVSKAIERAQGRPWSPQCRGYGQSDQNRGRGHHCSGSAGAAARWGRRGRWGRPQALGEWGNKGERRGFVPLTHPQPIPHSPGGCVRRSSPPPPAACPQLFVHNFAGLYVRKSGAKRGCRNILL